MSHATQDAPSTQGLDTNWSGEQLVLTLINRQQTWALFKDEVYPFLAKTLQSGRKWVLSIKLETRSQAQNRLMWPLLTEFSRQLQWPVNGCLVTMTPDQWKDVLTAAFRQEAMALAMGLDGGVVLLGQRTSHFTKKAFAEWIDFLYATAADRSVRLPAWTWEEGH